jgi:hypothetical protein
MKEARRPRMNFHELGIPSGSVLVYTDGYLTDGVVNAAQWRSHGVDLIGAAVGYGEYDATTKRKNLTKHFGRAIMAEDGEKLATKIVQYIAANTR